MNTERIPQKESDKSGDSMAADLKRIMIRPET